MNALEEFREMIEEHWPHSNPSWREGEMQFAPMIDAIADRIEAEYTPYPLDADGVPCKIGDRVKSGETYGDIEEMLLFERGRERWEIYLTALDDSPGSLTRRVVPADSLHHVEQPKLTKEDIDAKAKVGWAIDYWGCRGTPCGGCPSRIEGKVPREYYGVRSCEAAMVPDILRLERERIARMEK